MPQNHLAALKTEPVRLHSQGTQALHSLQQPTRFPNHAWVLALSLGLVGGPSAWANPAVNLNAVTATIAKLPVNGKVSSKPEVQTQGPVQMAAPLRLPLNHSSPRFATVVPSVAAIEMPAVETREIARKPVRFESRSNSS